MGLFQIMGFNYRECGFTSVQEFVNVMCTSEGEHLRAFVNFINSQGFAKFLKNKEWSNFARGYNGPDYAENKYDEKLAAAYKAASHSK